MLPSPTMTKKSFRQKYERTVSRGGRKFIHRVQEFSKTICHEYQQCLWSTTANSFLPEIQEQRLHKIHPFLSVLPIESNTSTMVEYPRNRTFLGKHSLYAAEKHQQPKARCRNKGELYACTEGQHEKANDGKKSASLSNATRTHDTLPIQHLP